MSPMITRVLSTRAGYGLTILRIFVGIIFAAHGSQKLFGWFGGGGLAGTAQWMESIGLAPGTLMALLSGGTEFFAGLALIIGLLVRPAALGLTFLTLVAIFSVHIHNGLFMANNVMSSHWRCSAARWRCCWKVRANCLSTARSLTDRLASCTEGPLMRAFSLPGILDTAPPASLGCCSCADLNS